MGVEELQWVGVEGGAEVGGGGGGAEVGGGGGRRN